MSHSAQAPERGFVGQALDALPKPVRTTGALIGLVGVSAFGGNAILGGNGSEGTPEVATAQSSGGEPNCDDLNLVDTAQNLDRKFLPAAGDGISNNDEAANYTRNLSVSANNSPLGNGETDPAALATLEAVFVGPSTDRETNVDRNYREDFRNNLSRLRGDDGKSVAQRLCEKAYVVLGSTVKHEENAINKGEDYITVSSVMGESDKVEDIAFERHTSPANISGATYRVRLEKQTVEIDGKKVTLNGGSKKMIIQPDGEINLTGVSRFNVSSKSGKAEKPSGRKEAEKDNPSGRKNSQKNDKGEAQDKNGGGGKNGTGQGNGTTHEGNSPEKNRGPVTGNNKDNNTGGRTRGNDHPATSGPDNTPSGGGGNGGRTPSSGGNGGGNGGNGSTPNTGGNGGGNGAPAPAPAPTQAPPSGGSGGGTGGSGGGESTPGSGGSGGSEPTPQPTPGKGTETSPGSGCDAFTPCGRKSGEELNLNPDYKETQTIVFKKVVRSAQNA